MNLYRHCIYSPELLVHKIPPTFSKLSYMCTYILFLFQVFSVWICHHVYRHEHEEHFSTCLLIQLFISAFKRLYGDCLPIQIRFPMLFHRQTKQLREFMWTDSDSHSLSTWMKKWCELNSETRLTDQVLSYRSIHLDSDSSISVYVNELVSCRLVHWDHSDSHSLWHHYLMHGVERKTEDRRM